MLAGELAALLPADWKVQPYPSQLRAIDPDLAALVMLNRTDLNPGDETGAQISDVELWLVSPVTATDDGLAEDTLDALLDQLLAVLDGTIGWSTAERSTMAGVWPAWRVASSLGHHYEPDPEPDPEPAPEPAP